MGKGHHFKLTVFRCLSLTAIKSIERNKGKIANQENPGIDRVELVRGSDLMYSDRKYCMYEEACQGMCEGQTSDLSSLPKAKVDICFHTFGWLRITPFNNISVNKIIGCTWSKRCINVSSTLLSAVVIGGQSKSTYKIG